MLGSVGTTQCKEQPLHGSPRSPHAGPARLGALAARLWRGARRARACSASSRDTARPLPCRRRLRAVAAGRIPGRSRGGDGASGHAEPNQVALVGGAGKRGVLKHHQAAVQPPQRPARPPKPLCCFRLDESDCLNHTTWGPAGQRLGEIQRWEAPRRLIQVITGCCVLLFSRSLDPQWKFACV